MVSDQYAWSRSSQASQMMFHQTRFDSLPIHGVSKLCTRKCALINHCFFSLSQINDRNGSKTPFFIELHKKSETSVYFVSDYWRILRGKWLIWWNLERQRWRNKIISRNDWPSQWYGRFMLIYKYHFYNCPSRIWMRTGERFYAVRFMLWNSLVVFTFHIVSVSRTLS